MLGVLKDFRTSANYSAVPSGAWGTEAGNYSSKTVFQITSFQVLWLKYIKIFSLCLHLFCTSPPLGHALVLVIELWRAWGFVGREAQHALPQFYSSTQPYEVGLFPPCYRWQNWGSEKATVKHLGRERAGFKPSSPAASHFTFPDLPSMLSIISVKIICLSIWLSPNVPLMGLISMSI